MGSMRNARKPRRAKLGDIRRAWSLGGMSDRLSDRRKIRHGPISDCRIVTDTGEKTDERAIRLAPLN